MTRLAAPLFFLAFLFLLSPLSAKIILPSFFGDNMVLQQKTEAAIWGWAKPNSTVQLTSSWNKKKYTVNSDQTGKWIAGADKVFRPATANIRNGTIVLSSPLVTTPVVVRYAFKDLLLVNCSARKAILFQVSGRMIW